MSLPATKPIFTLPTYPSAFPVNMGSISITPDNDIFSVDGVASGYLNFGQRSIAAHTYSIAVEPGYTYVIDNYFNLYSGLWESISLYNPANGDFYHSYKYSPGESVLEGNSPALVFDRPMTLNLNVVNAISYDRGSYQVDVYATPIPKIVFSGEANRTDTYRVNDSSNLYKFAVQGGNVLASKGGSGYSFSSVERIIFNGNAFAFDIDGNAGQTYRMYQAAFDRKPDLGGLGAQINGMDNGLSLLQIANNFMNSAEFKLKYGTGLTNSGFVTQLYQNVLHRAPDAAGFTHQLNAVDTGAVSRGQLLVNFSESQENKIAVIGSIQNGIEYIPVA